MKYSHSAAVHVIAIVGLMFFGGMSVFAAVISFWLAFAFFFALAAVLAWLYWREGLAEWRVANEGLQVRGPLRDEVIPWASITDIHFMPVARVCQIRSGRRVATFMSLDCFPRLTDLLEQISEKSGRPLPPGLLRAISLWKP